MALGDDFINISQLAPVPNIAFTDIIHLRTAGGIDNKITFANVFGNIPGNITQTAGETSLKRTTVQNAINNVATMVIKSTAPLLSQNYGIDLQAGSTVVDFGLRVADKDNNVALRVSGARNVLVRTDIDDGVNALQINGSARINNNLNIGSQTGEVLTPDYIKLSNSFSDGLKDSLKINFYESGTVFYGFGLGNSANLTYHSDSLHEFYGNNNTKIVTIGGPTDKLTVNGSTTIAPAVATAPPSLGANGGTFRLLGSTGLYGLLAGIDPSGFAWIQDQRIDGSATAYALKLQPSGGSVTIGSPSDIQNINLRAYGDLGGAWKGSAAFGYTSSSVIMGEFNGIATIGGHSSVLDAWANLHINPDGGRVILGATDNGIDKLQVPGSAYVSETIHAGKGRKLATKYTNSGVVSGNTIYNFLSPFLPEIGTFIACSGVLNLPGGGLSDTDPLIISNVRRISASSIEFYGTIIYFTSGAMTAIETNGSYVIASSDLTNYSIEFAL